MELTTHYELTAENCLFDLEMRSCGDVILAMINALKSSGAITEVQPVYSAVIEREKIRGTGLGRGIACPHGKIEGLKGVQVAVARLKTPVDFKAADGVLARHVFLILTGKTMDVSVHLKTLSEIVKCYQSPGVIKLMDEAGNKTDYLNILQACHDE